MKTLFDQTTLGQRTLKNRVWHSATWLALADLMLTSRLMAEAGIDAIVVSGNGTSRTLLL